MAVKSVNLNGYKTPSARSHRVRRAMSADNLIAAFRFLGMSDEEIKAELMKMKVPLTENESKEPCTHR